MTYHRLQLPSVCCPSHTLAGWPQCRGSVGPPAAVEGGSGRAVGRTNRPTRLPGIPAVCTPPPCLLGSSCKHTLTLRLFYLYHLFTNFYNTTKTNDTKTYTCTLQGTKITLVGLYKLKQEINHVEN